MPKLASILVERKLAQEYSSRYTCQGTENTNVTSIINPLIYIKTKQESEKSCNTQVNCQPCDIGRVLLGRQTFEDRLSNDDFASNWTIGVHNIYNSNVSGLNSREVDSNVRS